MNELKNVHYTGNGLLWLESGFPNKPNSNDILVTETYNRYLQEALSKAVRFENVKNENACFFKLCETVGIDGEFELVAGESYYLDPKLVEVVEQGRLKVEHSLIKQEHPWQSRESLKSYVKHAESMFEFRKIARIVEPREEQKTMLATHSTISSVTDKAEEQKESQEEDDFKLWYDFLYEVGSRCFLLHGEGFDDTKWEVIRDQLKAKGYSITRNLVTK